MEVYRDYKLHIDFNIDLEQFSVGMDIVKSIKQKTRFFSETSFRCFFLKLVEISGIEPLTS